MAVCPPVYVQCEDDTTWVNEHDTIHPVNYGCDVLNVNGHNGYSCEQLVDASGVFATQACSVTCSGGDVTACPAFDNCWDSPCLNGGVCTDGLGTFTCTCPPQFGGATCELSLAVGGGGH